MSSVQQSHLNKSKKDKFVLVLTLPPLMQKLNTTEQRNNKKIQLNSLQFSVYGSIVPRIQVPAVEARYSGSTIHISSHSHPTYAPITINFTIDNRFNNYWVIYTWLNALRDQNEGVYGIVDAANTFDKSVNLNDYSTDMTIYGKDEMNTDIISWTYKRAFPIALSEINYNYKDSGEIEASCEFAFHEVIVNLLETN